MLANILIALAVLIAAALLGGLVIGLCRSNDYPWPDQR